MLQHVTIATAFLGTLAAAQDYLNTPNPRRDIATCQDLPCDPTGNNICALNNDNDDNGNDNNNGIQPGVGIVPSALRIGSADISLVLISADLNPQADPSSDINDAEGAISAYQSTPHHLYVGIDPSIDQGDYPSGCLLMLQYQGQTFPAPTDSSARPEGINGTTSCQGVLDNGCRADIYDAIQSFNGTSCAQNSTTTLTADEQTCEALAEHVTTTLANRMLCGDTYIASMIRVTGGALPEPDAAVAESPRLRGINECRPMLPQAFSMYEVAQTQTWWLRNPEDMSGGGDQGGENNQEYMNRVFGGRRGFTPVFSVRFTEDEGVEVQLACMRTYERDGEVLGAQNVQEAAAAGRETERARAFAVVAGFVAVVFTALMA